MYTQWESFDDHSTPYLTGNGFAAHCQHIWNYGGFRVHPIQRNNWVFVKTDHINAFFELLPVPAPFVLFTHNSDLAIDETYLPHLNSPKLVAWCAQNAALDHFKLVPIPIGIANAGYPHGDISILNDLRETPRSKRRLFYANYSVATNPAEREYCLRHTHVPLIESSDGGWRDFVGGYMLPLSFEAHLREMSDSYFCISPKGHGLDCHRTWEALYVGTIPIVTRTRIAQAHRDWPIVILDDWAQFDEVTFTVELYHRLWGTFDRESLNIDRYLQRVQSHVAAIAERVAG